MSATHPWSKPRLRLYFTMRSAPMLASLIMGCGSMPGKDLKRPRFSEVQQSIQDAKVNALRVRTDSNREEFLSILNDVESALDSARRDAGKSKKLEVMEKIHRIKPDVRSALISSSQNQSSHVKKIRSVQIHDHEAQAKDKGIVRVITPQATQKKGVGSRLNPMRWFGRNRQYTKVIERSPKPQASNPAAARKVEDVMVRIPPIPYTRNTPAPPPVSAPAPRVNPSVTAVAPEPPASVQPIHTDKPLVEPGKKNTNRYQPHRFIPIDRRGASRRISELNRDGEYRLPGGAVESDSNTSRLRQKIKKPERKSTRAWDFGPKDSETEFVAPTRPEPQWTQPNKPIQMEPQVEKTNPPSRVEEEPTPKSRTSWFPKLQLPKSNTPSPRIPSRPGPGRFKQSSPTRSSEEDTAPAKEANIPTKKTVTVKTWKQPTVLKGGTLPARKTVPPLSASATSARIVVRTKPKAPSVPVVKKLPNPASAVSGPVIADTRPNTLAPKAPMPVVPSIELPPAPEAGQVALPPVVEKASTLANEIREEEARTEAKLEDIDQILSDNAEILKDAEALLGELKALEKKSANASKKLKPKPSSKGTFHRPGMRRPVSRQKTPSKPTSSPADKEAVPQAPVQKVEPVRDAVDAPKPDVSEVKEDPAPDSKPAARSKWGPQIRRPGVRR